MDGIYKGKKYRVAKISTFYRVISREKEEGFESLSIFLEKKVQIFLLKMWISTN